MAQADEKRFERQRGWRLSSSNQRHDSRTISAARVGAREPFGGAVPSQLVEVVEVRDDRLGADGHGDEVAIPRRRAPPAPASTLSRFAPNSARRSRCSRSRSGRSSHSTLGLSPPAPRPQPSPPSRTTDARPRRARTTDRRRRARASVSSSSRRAPHPRRAAARAVEPAARHARQRRDASAASPGACAASTVVHGLLGQATEGDGLAAGADRLRQRAELVCEQDQHRVRRRLLEILEQRVGGLLVQQSRGDEQVHAPLGLERTHVEVAPQPAHRRRCGSGRRAARAGRGRDAPPSTRPRVAEQVARERERRRLLADAGRAVEEVRVSRPVPSGRRAGAWPRAAR